MRFFFICWYLIFLNLFYVLPQYFHHIILSYLYLILVTVFDYSIIWFWFFWNFYKSCICILLSKKTINIKTTFYNTLIYTFMIKRFLLFNHANSSFNLDAFVDYCQINSVGEQSSYEQVVLKCHRECHVVLFEANKLFVCAFLISF